MQKVSTNYSNNIVNTNFDKFGGVVFLLVFLLRLQSAIEKIPLGSKIKKKFRSTFDENQTVNFISYRY